VLLHNKTEAQTIPKKRTSCGKKNTNKTNKQTNKENKNKQSKQTKKIRLTYIPTFINAKKGNKTTVKLKTCTYTRMTLRTL